MSFFEELRNLYGTFSLAPTLYRANNLMMEGRNEEALVLLGDVAGLQSADYQDPERLRGKLKKWFDDHTNQVAATYCLTLGGAFGAVRQMQQGLLVLETYLKIEPADYDDTKVLSRKLNRRLGDLPPDLGFTIYSALTGNLDIMGRESESLALLLAYLGVPPVTETKTQEEHEQWQETVSQRVIDLLSEMMPDAVAMNLTMLLPNLEQLGLSGDRLISTIETALDLEAEDYESDDLLDQKLQSWIAGMSQPFNGYFTLQTLAAFIHQFGQPEKSLQILEWCYQIQPSDYRNIEHLSHKWQSFWSDFAPDAGATSFRIFVDVLGEAGRNPREDALAIIEADSGLRAEDYNHNQRIIEKLNRRLQLLQIDTQAAYVFSLIDSLLSLGYRGRASAVLDSYLRNYRNLWNIPSSGDVGIMHVIPLLTSWLQNCARNDKEFTFKLSQQAVVYLRKGFGQRGVKLEDRQEFVRYVDALRRAMLEAGYYWTYRADENQTGLRLQVQLWDMELAQRALLERFLLEPMRKVRSTKILPANELRLFSVRQTAREGRSTLSQSDEPTETTFSEEATFVDENEATTIEAMEVEENLRTSHPRLHARLRRITEQGIDEQFLAESLGKNTLLLRATFDSEGRLIWTATLSDGKQLSVSAVGRGQTEDFDFFRVASAKHDFRMKVALLVKRKEPRILDLRDSIQKWKDYFEHLASSNEVRVQELNAIWQETYQTFERLSPTGDELELWRLSHWWLWNASTAPEDFLTLAEREAERLQFLNDDIQIHLKEIKAIKDSSLTMKRVHSITQDYIDEVSTRWNLDALSGFFTPATDVILQVDDALHAFPIAHLPIAGQPLFRRVRSVRKSFSVLFQVLQHEAVKDFQEPDETNGRMLVVSWFDPENPKEDITRSWTNTLLQGHFDLANQYGLEFYSAADNPAGTLSAISAALEAYQSLRVLAVCGHGNLYQAGVRLQDGLWRGQGCNLSRVGLLLMVSCAIGRLNQEGDLDVDGFCVQLAMHRALSVIACRWSILSSESCAFANEIVSQYLRLQAELEGQDVNEACLRARALNTARKAFISDGAPTESQSQVGLNTTAAFDLYGLG